MLSQLVSHYQNNFTFEKTCDMSLQNYISYTSIFYYSFFHSFYGHLNFRFMNQLVSQGVMLGFLSI